MLNGDFFSYESIIRNPKKKFRIILYLIFGRLLRLSNRMHIRHRTAKLNQETFLSIFVLHDDAPLMSHDLTEPGPGECRDTPER